MPRPKYPLSPVLEHREKKVDDATAELGDAVRAREAADAARARAEAVKREAEERAAAVKMEEAERLARGELRAVDLARAEAWEFAAKAEIVQLGREVETAATRQGVARGAESKARDGLAHEMADRDVVVKDKARFLDRVKKSEEAKEEEAAEEAHRGGRRTW